MNERSVPQSCHGDGEWGDCVNSAADYPPHTHTHPLPPAPPPYSYPFLPLPLLLPPGYIMGSAWDLTPPILCSPFPLRSHPFSRFARPPSFTSFCARARPLSLSLHLCLSLSVCLSLSLTDTHSHCPLEVADCRAVPNLPPPPLQAVLKVLKEKACNLGTQEK